MKGISTIVAIVLILLIVVALVAIGYIWFSEIFTGLTETGGLQIESTTGKFGAIATIDSVYNDVVYLRNTGETDLSGFAIFFNDVPINFTADKTNISKDEIGKLIIEPVKTAAKDTNNKIRITTAQEAKVEFLISGMQGKTKKSDGTILGNVDITIYKNGKEIANTVSDEEGDYIIFLSPGTYDIEGILITTTGMTGTFHRTQKENQEVTTGEMTKVDIIF